MCRVLAYLGEPVLLDDLLYASDNSLVRQSYAPQMLGMLNLAGFGLAAWDPASHDPALPWLYHTDHMAGFDASLHALARKVRAACVLAHVRGVRYDERNLVGPQYLHPFLYEGVSVALAHNGDLHRFAEMRPLLQPLLKPQFSRQLRTTLDSEWIYALFLSQLDDPAAVHDGAELARALQATLHILAEVRQRAGIDTASSVNLFVANGQCIVALRWCFDFGCWPEHPRPGAVALPPADYLSLWYTLGQRYANHEGEWKLVGGRNDARAVLLASEPLTRDTSTWLEVPEYSLVMFDLGGGQPRVRALAVEV